MSPKTKERGMNSSETIAEILKRENIEFLFAYPYNPIIEPAVRAGIPILTIVLKNLSMAIELKNYPVATERYGTTDVTGNYADMAKGFGGYGTGCAVPRYCPSHQTGHPKDSRGATCAAIYYC